MARTGGTPRVLTTNPGSERAAAVSPAGDRLAYLHAKERGAETDLCVVDIAPDGTFTGAPRNVTTTWDRQPGTPEWLPDGEGLRFAAESNGSAHVWEVRLDQPVVRPVTSGDRYVRNASASRDGAWMAYAVDHPRMPPELFVAKGDASGERQVTRFNERWLKDVTLQPAERLTWKVKDGTEIDGWLVRPVNYAPGRTYPLILKIHGGPHTQYGNTWFRTFHVLSNSGFFVLYPNPRGSSGYGHAFQDATRGKWGELDTEDYLGGVDAAIATYREIDPKRIGVSGGSYGGFMTNWLSAPTDRFAAAVTSRSISNWENWYGTSDAQGLTEYEFSGAPWEQRELYRRLSPISYVEKVHIPTLIIHSENDYRTPIADGEQWFMALRKRKVPVEFIRYPRSTHDLSRTGEPWLLVDRLERIRSWFDHWLIQKQVTSPATPQPSRARRDDATRQAQHVVCRVVMSRDVPRTGSVVRAGAGTTAGTSADASRRLHVVRAPRTGDTAVPHPVRRDGDHPWRDGVPEPDQAGERRERRARHRSRDRARATVHHRQGRRGAHAGPARCGPGRRVPAYRPRASRAGRRR